MKVKQKRFLSRPLEALAWLAAVLSLAGIVHLATILAMPRLAPKDPFARIAALGPANKMVLLPPVAPGQEVLPFEDPATAIAACPYDLARGPVRLRGQIPPNTLVLLSFHARRGQTYYSMTDRSALRGKIDVVIATRDQLDDIEANDNEDELPQELRLESPSRQGFVLVRTLAERPSLMDEARERAASLSCEG